MKNREHELGRLVKLCKNKKGVPPDFIEWLTEAHRDGEDFAPNLVELSYSDQRRAYYDVRDKYKKRMRRNGGAYKAILSMFHFALAESILVNRNQEEEELIIDALHSSVIALNHMMCAFLWLPPEGRRLLADAGRYIPLSQKEYARYIQSSIASARFAYAAVKLGVNIRVATVEHDIFQKIDFFCEHPMLGCPTVCVQTKSHAGTEGVRFILLTEHPTKGNLPADEYIMRESVWRGVQRFNRQYKRRWVPVIARVGVQGMPIEELVDRKIISDLRLFFGSLPRRVRSCHSPSPQSDNDPYERACA
jgi:hypothetical protein